MYTYYTTIKWRSEENTEGTVSRCYAGSSMRKCGSLAERGSDGNLAAVQAGEMFYDGEAKAGTADLAACGRGRHGKSARKRAGRCSGKNAFAGVGDGNQVSGSAVLP